ncbi:Ycf66 family protein [Anabaena sp. UHCC 0399]|uniref:Ycf66 family protein n=1 Tax=Anabaena sp. UHCC 0399 TaxID=3110238 RepID=UPI003A4C6FF1
MIGWIISRKNTLNNAVLLIYILQGVLSPVLLLVSGIILILQGWRLDPLLQFQQFLLLLLIIYLSFKDIMINIIQRIR